MGFQGGNIDWLVNGEVREAMGRVNGRIHSVDTVSMMERLVERLLATGEGSARGRRSRSMSPASRRVIAELVAEDSFGSGAAGAAATGSGSIPGQWNEREREL